MTSKMKYWNNIAMNADYFSFIYMKYCWSASQNIVLCEQDDPKYPHLSEVPRNRTFVNVPIFCSRQLSGKVEGNFIIFSWNDCTSPQITKFSHNGMPLGWSLNLSRSKGQWDNETLKKMKFVPLSINICLKPTTAKTFRRKQGQIQQAKFKQQCITIRIIKQ